MRNDSLIVVLVGSVPFEPNEAPMCAHVATSAVAGRKRQRGQGHFHKVRRCWNYVVSKTSTPKCEQVIQSDVIASFFKTE